MSQTIRPFRSVLYIPASNARALEKAQSLQADAIIFDLEDAVAPAEKTAARDVLKAALAERDYGKRYRIVRINGFDTEWGSGDLDMLKTARFDAVLLPKLETPEAVDKVTDALGAEASVWAMMETPAGILNAAQLAQLPALEGFVMGTNDLAKELRSNGREAMRTSLQHCLLAARAAGIVCVDGVYNAFKDAEGLEAECIEGRNYGFDGKTLIHPAQLEIANRIFAPSSDDADLARRQIEAYEEAIARGEAVAVVDGRIVENLHVETARHLLAQVEAIEEMEAAA